VAANHSTRASLEALGEPKIDATLAGVGRATNGHAAETDVDDDPDRTANLSLGAATSDGQRLRVLRPHARGGLGEVFVAFDTELRREVALKQILDAHADDPVSRQLFLLEAEVTGGLEHPGIVPVYALGAYSPWSEALTCKRRRVATGAATPETGPESAEAWKPPTASATAVRLQEIDDVDAGWQLDQALSEPQEQLFDLGGRGVGLGLADLPDGEGVPLTSVRDLAVLAVALALNGSHRGCPPGQRHRDVTPAVAVESQKGRIRRSCN
jgi:hypothetical protein